ncbi:thioredoxin reductase [Paenibacillus castaneae]|uniref:NAD(P)/FAD-dependent oxidoreductase n=1 Tax=Paenibacillus castaneae TaxID=474957 RepID=UPI000C9C3B86|nr:NAD(P)/FAD-dependent oxidoreductase [Paenibacillus castaneae]NIK76755.1 thioredoxin reductase [Paenibacillus castaneae]
MRFDCIIVGGGIAGLQAAVQLGRYRHKVAVIDAADGRSRLCRSYHNLLGWQDGVSGAQLLAAGREQAERLHVQFIRATADTVREESGGFVIHTNTGETFHGKRLLLATGVKDRLPPFPELLPCMGISVYICPDCDGYEVADRRTIVIGSGNPGANMALTLMHWTTELIYVNHELAALDEQLFHQLEQHRISYIKKSIHSVITQQSSFKGVELSDGTVLEAERCFVALGGNIVRSDIAEQLNVQLSDNKHILVDARTKKTSVQHVWAAGDVTAHSEMAAIAMGDGSQAAIWIHKSLIEAIET